MMSITNNSISITTTYPSIVIREPATLNPTTHSKHYEFLKAPSPRKYRIRFRHPAYAANDNIIFTLHAWDHPEGGIHYGLAHCACAIIADNRVDGYLSRTADGEFGDRIDAAWDDILPVRDSDYYFYVPHLPSARPNASTSSSPATPRTPYRWPIVPSFQDWSFPSQLHDVFARCSGLRDATTNIAAQSQLSAAVHQRDITCRVTSFHSSTQVAHLIPEHEKAWFLLNSMSMWNDDTTLDPDNLLRDLSNGVLLRSDIHTAFDDRKFVFFPKGSDGFVVHMLEPTPDIGQLYHNRPINISGCGIEFLYARFAWSIFPFLSGFLSKPGTSRLVVRLSAVTGERISEEVRDLVKLAARAKSSRSNSPTNRVKRAAETQDLEGTPSANRRRTSGPSRSISTCKSTTPSLDEDQSFNSALYWPRSQDEVTPPVLVQTCEELTSLEVLRRDALKRQRPPGFIAQKQPYRRSRPAREELEIMGVEIIEDGDDLDLGIDDT